MNIVDWSKIKVDTEVIVSDNNIDWKHRHFAMYKDGRFYTWEQGKTSFTVYKKIEAYMVRWQYCKLYRE